GRAVPGGGPNPRPGRTLGSKRTIPRLPPAGRRSRRQLPPGRADGALRDLHYLRSRAVPQPGVGGLSDLLVAPAGCVHARGTLTASPDRMSSRAIKLGAHLILSPAGCLARGQEG